MIRADDKDSMGRRAIIYSILVSSKDDFKNDNEHFIFMDELQRAKKMWMIMDFILFSAYTDENVILCHSVVDNGIQKFDRN